MSETSYAPSSSDYGQEQAISQHHYFYARELKQENHRAAKRQRDDRSVSPSPVKHEPDSPSETPRVSAVEANIRLEEQYAAALNSQMGENTFIETLFNEKKPSSPKQESQLDDADFDLMRWKCHDLEGEHDHAYERLDEVQAELDEAIRQRDAALVRCGAWEKAADYWKDVLLARYSNSFGP
ncbi:hypothetical protein DFH06DRAFT_1323864 [Mycena polygramma]|nr:hypothetical protein DFH06DRAFT_1323864 [Mycena polygramma]